MICSFPPRVQVSNTSEVIRAVAMQPQSRVFALGLGDGASHELVEGIGERVEELCVRTHVRSNRREERKIKVEIEIEIESEVRRFVLSCFVCVCLGLPVFLFISLSHSNSPYSPCIPPQPVRVVARRSSSPPARASSARWVCVCAVLCVSDVARL